MIRYVSKLLPTVALVATVGGCAASNANTKTAAPDPRVVKRDELIGKLRDYQEEVNKANFRFTAAATNYERSKDDYQKKLTLAMAAKKASGRELKALEKNRGTLAQMIHDRDQLGLDLQKAFDTLIAAQKTRNTASLALLDLEGKLWELEDKAGGGHEAVQKRAAPELDEVRKAAQAVADTAKVQGEAQAAVINKEVEVSQLIGTDVAKRDEADQALDGLREKLEAAATSYIAATAASEAAKAKYHKKIFDGLPPGPARDQVEALLDQRAAAAKQLEDTQSAVKNATIDRAAQTKQRFDYDSEIDRVVAAGLTSKVKTSVLDALKKETEAIGKGRTDMQTEDTSALGLQQKIAATEIELEKLAY